MEIIKQALLDNGWVQTPGGFARFFSSYWLAEVIFDDFGNAKIFFDDHLVPNIRTLEALAQLEWLLSDRYEQSIATLPDFAQADARLVDQTIAERGLPR